jgi:hypothetical protein
VVNIYRIVFGGVRDKVAGFRRACSKLDRPLHLLFIVLLFLKPALL